MKRFLLAATFCLFLSLLVIPSFCFAQDGSTITGVHISCIPTTVQPGQTSSCPAYAYGTGDYDPGVTWSLSNVCCAGAPIGTVDGTGLVTAPSNNPTGTVVRVTATSVQDPTKTASVVLHYSASAPLIQASSEIFSDAAGTGWVFPPSNSYANTTSDIAYQGDYGILVQAPYTNVILMGVVRTTPGYTFNTAGYGFLTLSVNIGTYEGETVLLSLTDVNGNALGYVSLANYVSDGILEAYRWETIQIPLGDLGATNTNVYGFNLWVQSSVPATFSLDEISFTANGGCN